MSSDRLEVPARAGNGCPGLDDEEMDRLAGFRTESLRTRFAVAHARPVRFWWVSEPPVRGGEVQPRSEQQTGGPRVPDCVQPAPGHSLCAVAAGPAWRIIETPRTVPDAESLSPIPAPGEAEEFQLPAITREHVFRA
jgi:hypothetical protein